MIENSQNALARWERLVTTLANHGVTATLTERRYPGGISFGIAIVSVSGQHVVICDSFWRDHWTGWHVYVEDPSTDLSTSLVAREKTRGGVARAVAAHLAAAVSA